ncbi:hypothetical protein [Muricoccus radiodurans]|uniref:hypothetical protein n=1 Tax=Muricoccus radiodurans TaxID=2231721 RepID=UPI003CF7F969
MAGFDALSADEAELLERGLLEWVAEDVLERLSKSVPPDQRDALLALARAQMGRVLCTAVPQGDPVEDVMIRANLAAAFRATYDE